MYNNNRPLAFSSRLLHEKTYTVTWHELVVNLFFGGRGLEVEKYTQTGWGKSFFFFFVFFTNEKWKNVMIKPIWVQIKAKLLGFLETFKGDLQTICRFSYMKVYKLITLLGTEFKNLLSLGGKITMFSKFITNYIEQGWWHSSLSLKCMHLQLKEVNKRGRHA